MLPQSLSLAQMLNKKGMIECLSKILESLFWQSLVGQKVKLLGELSIPKQK
jgi:hypothetical protein